jgi:hypothetical protein
MLTVAIAFVGFAIGYAIAFVHGWRKAAQVHGWYLPADFRPVDGSQG